MCVGGIAALRHAQHPRVTALVRLLSEPRRQAVDRGLRLVLLTFFGFLIVPAYHLTVSSAGESLPASGISGAWISLILPVALGLMSAVVIAQLYRDGAGPWRERTSLAWSLGTAGVAIASVLIPLVAGAAPLVVLVIGFLVTGALGLPLAFTLALTSLTYLLGIGGVGLIILPIKILGGVDSFVLLAIPLFILAGALMESAAGWRWWSWSRRFSSPASPVRRRQTFRRSAPSSCRRCEGPATPVPSRSASSRPPPRWASSCRRA
jgi:hypothetical protein